MLRMIAYGGESNFAHPPRPTDPKAAWEPEWAVRVRVKAHTMAMLGQEQESSAGRAQGRRRGAEQPSPATAAEQPTEQTGESSMLPVNPGAILKGLFGR
jgi:hypothetical protein